MLGVDSGVTFAETEDCAERAALAAPTIPPGLTRGGETGLASQVISCVRVLVFWVVRFVVKGGIHTTVLRSLR